MELQQIWESLPEDRRAILRRIGEVLSSLPVDQVVGSVTMDENVRVNPVNHITMGVQTVTVVTFGDAPEVLDIGAGHSKVVCENRWVGFLDTGSGALKAGLVASEAVACAK